MNFSLLLILVSIPFSTPHCLKNFTTQTSREDIVNCLLSPSNYHRILPPLPVGKQRVIGTYLLTAHVDSIDESLQFLSIPTLLWLYYTDERLCWDENITGVGMIEIDRRQLWQANPIWNERTFTRDNYDVAFEELEAAKIFSDGVVQMLRVMKDPIKCRFDNSRFPLGEFLSGIGN